MKINLRIWFSFFFLMLKVIVLIMVISCKKEVNNPPTASFTASETTITKGSSVNFIDQSTNSPTSWNWDFGDGGTSTEQNPNHTYLETGSFTVTLTSTNNYGSDTETKNDYITVSLFGSVSDKDGNKYNTIVIGTQTWMAENLKSTKFNDGTTITLVTDNSAWNILTTFAYCWYNNEIINKSKYGALYNYFAVANGKLCPTGWHMPTNEEWTTLTSFMGGSQVAGGNLKNMGFVGLPGGVRTINVGFAAADKTVYWWSSTTSGSSSAWGISINNVSNYIFFSIGDKKEGLSVRCIKDN